MNPGKVASMRKILLGIVALALAAGLAGCEDDTKEKARELSFDNQSRYTVHVVPLTIEWSKFPLLSGQKRTLKNIKNPDFTYTPDWKVEEGVNSTERRVIFVDLSS